MNNLYSDELKQIVDKMIKVEPEQRLGIHDVVDICEKRIKTRPRIDPILVMDDINDKLQLLDYENRFCIPLKLNPISKVFFALELDEEYEQYRYMIEICYWLMSLNRSIWDHLNLGSLPK